MKYLNRDKFTIVDPISQGRAIQEYIKGWDKEEILCWLEQKGKLARSKDIFGNEVFYFETIFGFKFIFYLKEDRFRVVGDHTTFTFDDDRA